MQPVSVQFATYINPVLAALLLPAPFLSPPREEASRRQTPSEFWLRCALGIGLAVALAESGKRFEVWPGHATFPSGHETFGLAAAACLVICDRRWIGLAVPLTLILAWALVVAHFHQPADIAGAVLLGPPCALLCHRLKPFGTPNPSESR